MSLVDVSVSESIGTMQVPIRLSRAATERVEVLVATRPGSAINGRDFFGTSLRIGFAAGETGKVLRINVIDDAYEEEERETFQVRILDVTGANVGRRVATITIEDDDAGALPQFSIAGELVDESRRLARVKVALVPPARTTTTVGVATVAQTARPGMDHYGLYRRLSFAPGESEKTIAVTILDDTEVEEPEVFIVRLFKPSANAAIDRRRGTAEVVIFSDDGF